MVNLYRDWGNNYLRSFNYRTNDQVRWWFLRGSFLELKNSQVLHERALSD